MLAPFMDCLNSCPDPLAPLFAAPLDKFPLDIHGSNSLPETGRVEVRTNSEFHTGQITVSFAHARLVSGQSFAGLAWPVCLAFHYVIKLRHAEFLSINLEIPDSALRLAGSFLPRFSSQSSRIVRFDRLALSSLWQSIGNFHIVLIPAKSYQFVNIPQGNISRHCIALTVPIQDTLRLMLARSKGFDQGKGGPAPSRRETGGYLRAGDRWTRHCAGARYTKFSYSPLNFRHGQFQ